MKVPYLPLLVIFILALISGCKKPQNNTLVVHIINEPEDMHPTNGASAIRAEINLYTHLSLLRLNFKTGELIPCMVKSLPSVSSNGLEFTYELKDEIRWDDKTPVTAADVVFTTKANKCLFTNNPALKSYWDNIKEVIADSKNPKKFTVFMNRQYMLNTWFWTDFPIIEEAFYDKEKTLSKYSTAELTDSTLLKTKTDVKKWADDFNSPKYYTDPNFISGCGPYKITKWDKGISLTIEKKKDYWASKDGSNWYTQAFPDKIIFKLNNSNASAKLELKNGLIDVSTYADYASFVELSKDKVFTDRYITKLSDTYNYIYIAMNMKPEDKKRKQLFTDVSVRRAMAMLVPYDQINKTVFENNNRRMIGPISTLKKDFNKNLKAVEFNITKANDILKSCGWTDTDNDQILDKVIDGEKVNFEFDINFLSTQKQWEDIAKQIAESMQKAKIFVRLNPVDYNSFVSAVMGHDFDMSIGAWQSSAQPEDFSQLWSSASWKNNGLNFPGFGDSYSDAMIDSINTCMNESTRIEISKRFQKKVYDEQPYIFLFEQARRVVVNKRWNNLEIYAEYPGVLLNTLKLND